MLVVAFALMGIVAVNRVIDDQLSRIERVDLDVAASPAEGANYLVVGSDSRSVLETEEDRVLLGGSGVEPGGTRSDTIMVVHVEPGSQRTLVVSFPRDLWVEVPGVGMSKINAAFNSDLGGGPQRVVETITENFGIPIHHYLEVNFKSFAGIVDAVGRIPIYLDRPVVDEFTGFVAVKPGCITLAGPDALAWVRTRHLKYLNPTTSRLEEDPRADLSRIERQQDFMRRLAAKAMHESLRNPFTARRIADKLVRWLKADAGFSRDNLFDLAQAFRTVNPDDTSALEFETFPFKEGPLQQGQSVIYPDRTIAPALLDRLTTFGSEPLPEPAPPGDVRVRVLNASGRTGLAKSVLGQLVALGFVSGGSGDDLRGRIGVTEVRYATGADAEARTVLERVGPTAKLVPDPDITGADVVVVLGGDFAGLVGATTSGGPDAAATTGSTAAATTATTAAPSASVAVDPAAAACR